MTVADREQRSRSELEAELATHREEYSRLEQEVDEYGLDPTSRRGAASSAARINKGNEARRKQASEKIAELEAALSRLRDDEKGGQPQSTVGDQVPSTDHPIFAVEGRCAQLSDLVGATLEDGDHAFSASTRAALAGAARVPVGETEDGALVVGPASFLRACLAEESAIRPDSRSMTLNGMLAAQVLARGTWSDEVRERLAFRDRLVTPVPPPKRASEDVPGPPSSPAELAHAIADEALTRALADAARLVPQLTPHQTRVDIRHALLAVLKTPQAQRVFFELGVVESPEGFFADLFGAVGEYLAGEHADSSEGLAAILSQLTYAPEAAPPTPPRRSESVYVADAPATTLAQDRLGVADEARALAEVMCLREPGPPLAIGLFGDWGSGKSTFMNMIEGAVKELTDGARSDAVARRTLVGKVVHVKFNAWHYNDANLWASLTAEFFSQLRAGGHDAQAGSDYAALVRGVLARVTTLEGEVASQGVLAALARRDTASLGAELERLEKRRDVEPFVQLSAAVRDMVPRDDDAQVSRVREAMAALGHPVEVPADKENDSAVVRAAIEKRMDVMQTEVERAASLPGRMVTFGRAVGRAFVRRDPKTVVLLCGVVLAAAATILLLREFDLDRVRTLLGGLGATVVFVLPLLRRSYRVIEPVLRAADDFARRLRESRKTLEADITQKRDELEAAEKKLSSALAARVEREAEATRWRGGTPSQVLDYFVNFSEETQRFDRDLGTVSRVRRAFEQLDAIFAERERLRREAGREETPKTDEKQLEQLDGVTDGIDRIVLYIDDLDRCQVHQVVRVLEAVHLLLAFPLFVVVVGVDSRWLQQSLLEFYDRQLRGPATEHGHRSPDDRAPVQDYLEKIFQIPLHLRRLGTTQDATFRAYLDSVVGPVEPDDRGTQDRRADVPQRDGRPTGGSASRIRTVSVKMKPARESAREVVERITLRKSEVDIMDALGVFHGKSPRAVKRFVNVYRLIRGLRRGEALTHFLEGTGGGPPVYPAVLFWLAVEIGRGPETSARYYRALASLKTGTLQTLHDALAGKVDADDATSSDLKKSMDAPAIDAFAAGLRALASVMPGRAGVEGLLGAHAETQRFTIRQTETVVSNGVKVSLGAVRNRRPDIT